MEPSSLATELGKLLLWLTLSENSFISPLIGMLGLVVVLKTIENRRGFSQKWAWLLNFHTCFARKNTIEPPSINLRSATVLYLPPSRMDKHSSSDSANHCY